MILKLKKELYKIILKICTMSIPSYRHILETFITQSDGKHIINHQLESFNQFIEVDIPESKAAVPGRCAYMIWQLSPNMPYLEYE